MARKPAAAKTPGPKKNKPRLPRSLASRRLRPNPAPRGRPIKPGCNSQSGEVFRRGPDILLRGSVRKLYEWLLNDDGSMAKAIEHDRSGSPRVRLMQSALKACDKPSSALHLLEMLADRLEGKPVQSVRLTERRTTIFQGPGMGEQPPAASGPPEIAPPDSGEPTLVPVELPEPPSPRAEFLP